MHAYWDTFIVGGYLTVSLLTTLFVVIAAGRGARNQGKPMNATDAYFTGFISIVVPVSALAMIAVLASGAKGVKK
jgi:hypothetical protein